MQLNRTRLLETFVDLVKIEGKSKSERNVADYIKLQLQKVGLTGTEDDTGSKIQGNCGNLVYHLPAVAKDIPRWLLLVHMDTVVPCAGVNPVIKDDTVYSSGDTILGADDRAGIAILIELARVIREYNLPHNEVWLVFTVAEEVGLLGATHLDIEPINVDYGLVLDSSGNAGRITVRQPTAITLDATFIGKSAHAGVCPEDGISAIQMAAWAISQMPLGRIDPETTATIGLISGGTARNIIPEKTEIKGGARSHNETKLIQQIALMKKCIEDAAGKYGGSVEITTTESFKRFAFEENHPLVQHLICAGKDVGLTPVLESTGGGSDANVINQKGIPTVSLTVGYQNAHTTRECISISELSKSAEWILMAITTQYNNVKRTS
ncbi:MAG: M20/M25/M40 family metallo-hydrolase [bacterium]|nr:M20/M25/M40 family metallo-hydrolase [bacterium]